MKAFKSVLLLFLVVSLSIGIPVVFSHSSNIISKVESYSAPIPTVSPRFLTVTSATSSVTLFYCASLVNSGVNPATISNSKGESVILGVNESLTIGQYSPNMYVDIITIAAPTTTVKIIYYK
jgi:hypothetical protein